jgi:hypothetical protein
MGDELENQLQRIENAVAELLAMLRTLHNDRHDDRLARPAGAAGINQRLRRFLEQKE